MQVNDLFYSWVPKYVRYAILFLMLFVVLSANGVYLGITTDMYNDLGEYSEPYTMATNALYIGMGASMIFLIRLATRFTGKTLVIAGFIMMLLMNLVIATTSSPALTAAASAILGFGKVFTIGQLYLAWLPIWSRKWDASRLYPFFYFMALAGFYFLVWFTAYLSKMYSWRYAYHAVFILIATCIILALVFLENHELHRKIPLYQLDIPGLLLFMIVGMLVNYIAVYGKVEDGFKSSAICAASFATIITTLLFIKRELSVKRPFLNLDLFKKFKFSAGLFLFILLGVFAPSTFQNFYSGSVLHFESIRNSEINLFLIPGFLAGAVLAFFWYKNNYSGHLLTIIGFVAIVAYHILMYGRFVNDLDIQGFWVPTMLKGAGQVILFISIGLYATSPFTFPHALKAVGLIIAIRSFFGQGIFSGLYNYYLYAERTRHLSRLAGALDANEPLVPQYANVEGFYKNIQQQANLTALKEISGSIIIFGLSVVFILVTLYVYGKIKKGLFANSL
jgi:MFS family permease